MQILRAAIFTLAFAACVFGTEDWETRNFNTILSIYENVQYPKNVQIVQSGQVPTDLFAPSVSGRINPIGNFTNAKELMEYFFALTPAISNNLVGAVLGKLVLVGFSSACPEVAAFSGYVPIIGADPTKTQYYNQTLGYIAQQGFFRFNSAGQVINYDLILESFQEVMNILFGDQTLVTNQLLVRLQICQIVTQYCNGSNLQYGGLFGEPDLATCLLQLTLKPYGYFWDTWSDTVACRLIHALLVMTDPVTHCPHVGPSGGMKCVDYSYKNKYFLDNDQLFGRKQPFVCLPNNTCAV